MQILQCVSRGHQNSEERLLDSILERCRSMSVGGAMLLNSVMSAFRPRLIAARATEFARMIRDLEDTGFPRYLLYRSLGLCMVVADPPEDQRLVLLNEVST